MTTEARTVPNWHSGTWVPGAPSIRGISFSMEREGGSTTANIRRTLADTPWGGAYIDDDATVIDDGLRPRVKGRGIRSAISAWMTRSDEPAAPESRLGSAVGMRSEDKEEDDGRRRRSKKKEKAGWLRRKESGTVRTARQR